MYRASLQVWDEVACRRVHEATLQVLAEVGVDVRFPTGVELFRGLGARVDGIRVRLDPALVESALAAAPRSWPLRSRGRDEVLDLADGRIYYGTGSDCLYTRDLSSGDRRRVRLADIESMAALSEKLPDIDFVMSMGLPEDAPHAIDDLAPVAAMMAGTRKPLIVAPRGGEVLDAMVEMAAACGEASSFAIYAMPSPPLMHDGDALSKLIRCAELQIPLVYAPAPSQGSTAPRSVTAVTVVGNAEVLSGLVLHQHVKPGAPFIYGVGGGAMNMSTALDPYAVPEAFLSQQLACDLAHHYGLPSFNYAACADSKCLDEQWAAEAALTTFAGSLSRGTLLHDVGYLETGLQSSHESIVFGAELVAWVKAFMREAAVDDEALAVDEIAAVGPGGNHLARRYTRRHSRDFWRPGVIDHTTFDRWQAAGGSTLGERLHARTAELASGPRAFELDPAAWDVVESVLSRVAESRES
jgi:trimethylamine--corrinoid protein Co-methyltransferase